ncbi:DoxX family protein [Paenibacillus cremeus]|uniref:DoxX family protein n=1 Tax=Paenibacillus cremeus TaxID=2163881 RepID=A0A559KGW2_9BACL|nr:DoxX family protein [Paenibacillus cremeus]TVY11369.1 DoxX family protein [Paenibacillus cremeus]
MKVQNVDLSTFLIRIVLGVIFLAHGLKKVKGMDATVHHFQIDFGLQGYIAYLVTFIEVVGGALLILGIFTRVASTGISIVMIGAIYTVTWNKGFINGYEFDLALLAMAISLIIKRNNAR